MADATTPLTLAFTISVGDQDAGTQEFEQEMVTIGKGAAAVLQIEDPALADLHAAVQLGDDDAVTLLDLGSDSGTLLNGKPINNEPVKDGDEIRIGNTVLVLGIRRPAEEAAAAAEEEVDTDDVSEAAAAAMAEHEHDAEEEIHDAEDVMDFVLRSGTSDSDLGIDRRAPKILEVAEVWSGTVMNVRHFAKDVPAVYVGDRRARQIRVASGILTSILVFGAMIFAYTHATLPAPPRFVGDDLALITKWEEEISAEKTALLEEKRRKREAEKLEVEGLAQERYEDGKRGYDRAAREKLEEAIEDNPESTKTIEDMAKKVMDEIIDEIVGEREKAAEEAELALMPEDKFLDYKRGWNEETDKVFKKMIDKNRDGQIPLVRPQFELWERPDFETYIEEVMLPVAAELAPKGKMSKSYVDEFNRFEKVYDRFDDLNDKRVVEDLYIGTRIMRADSRDDVLMLVAGYRADEVWAMDADFETVKIPNEEEVFVWDPSEAQMASRERLFYLLQEQLYINSRSRRQAGAKCKTLPNLLEKEEWKNNFEYNTEYAQCLSNKSEYEKLRGFIATASDNKPADVKSEANGKLYLQLLQVEARLKMRDAFGGDPAAHGTSLIPTAGRLEAERAHTTLRDYILENRRDPGALKQVDTGIYALGKEELKERQSGEVRKAFILSLFIVFLLPIGYGFDEIRSRKMAQDFFVSSENLPNDHFAIVEQTKSSSAVNFTVDSVGYLEKPDGTKIPTSDLVSTGQAKDVGGYYSVDLDEDDRFVNDIGHMVFFIHRVHKPKLIPGSPFKDMDWLFFGILLALLFLGTTFGIILATRPYDPSQEVITIPDRFVELMVQQVEKEKEKKKSSGNPDAGEGAKAKDEEGKTGKKEHKLKKAKGSKVAIQKSQLDKQIAESTGLLADLNQMTDNSVFGTGGLDSSVSNALGGLIGSQYGNQYGSGGLGSRGSGFGGGGTAAGLGGLGTRGSGLGASGYGRGAGFYGKKGGGAPGVGTGDPIILGALDKSLIDRVVKSHLAQIRYCYQRELAKNPKLFGKIVVKFVIAKDGTVSSASTKTSSMNNPIVERCINSRFMRMRFPSPKGGGIVIVSYPFVFNAQGG